MEEKRQLTGANIQHKKAGVQWCALSPLLS